MLTMRRTALKLCAILMLAVAALSASVTAQKKDTSAGNANAANLPERIWRDPGDMASLDLMYGAGGKAHAPAPTGTFTFVREDPLATSPKFDVADGQGVEWKVKLGQRLSMLTDDQIRDGFRAAGYGAGDVEILTRTIRTRIAALEAL